MKLKVNQIHLLNVIALIAHILIMGCSSDAADSGNGNNPPPPPSFSVPTITLDNISEITEFSAVVEANITDSGGLSISTRGICWSTEPGPDVNDTATSNGSGPGSFVADMTELERTTTYYVRAFATNDEGIGYSNELSFTTEFCNKGIYQGNLNLFTQQEVDDFGAECYTGVYGILGISSVGDPSDKIFDLSSLHHLEYIHGSLFISENPDLTSLAGLENITSVYNLGISFNNNLSDITALSHLEEIRGSQNVSSVDGTAPGITIRQNNSLVSLEGLEGIDLVGGLNIRDNAQLTSLLPLSNIASLHGELEISGNNSLVSLEGINGVSSTGAYCIIEDNPLIEDLSPLSGLTSVARELKIINNASLRSISALDNLNQAMDVFIQDNPVLENLIGVPQLDNNDGSLVISNNDALIDLTGIEGTAVSGWLSISSNDLLASLGQLSELTFVETLDIWSCPNLSTLDGLEHLITIEDDLQIYNNSSLSDFCALSNLVNNGSVGGVFNVNGNAFNPDYSHIENGNCSN